MNKRLKLLLEQQLSDHLRNLGFSTALKGFDYIRYAIINGINNPKYISNVTNVYRDIANKFEDTYSRVERAIRYSIELAIARGDKPELDKMFKYTISHTGKVSNSEFIATLVDIYNLKYELMLLDEDVDNMGEPAEI